MGQYNLIVHEYPMFLNNQCFASEMRGFNVANIKSLVGHCSEADPFTSHRQNLFSKFMLKVSYVILFDFRTGRFPKNLRTEFDMLWCYEQGN
jgi:hypothetical protein